MMRNGMLGALAALALIGCDSGSADTDGNGSVSEAEMKAETASAGPIRMQPGQWEMTVRFSEIDAPGMPAEAAAMMKEKMAEGVRFAHCLTPEEAASDGTSALFGGKMGQDCTVSKYDRNGGTMDLAMQCKSDGMVQDMAMNGSFDATSYKVNMTQSIKGGAEGAGMSMAMSGVAEGKRVSDCAG